MFVKRGKISEKKLRNSNKEPAGETWGWGAEEGLPRANRLEKSVSVRRKRLSLSPFSQESRFLEDCLSLKAPTSRLFSSRLLVLCKRPVHKKLRQRRALNSQSQRVSSWARSTPQAGFSLLL